MSLVINHNMMAANTARNLNNTYSRLSSSVERLSSGLRINSAADDAAGLAIRELMRADITTMQQGIRNAADAISMIQTADGGMAVIDEKLTRMKELAEQAATGTYTTLQREIINSEYQAMAAEIDRIATSTNFNGVKLLDGSITNLHGGLGMKIHFGVGNSADEDYYFINTGDVRATSHTGLRIGGDAKNDIWGQGAAGSKGLAGPGCCTAGYDSLDGKAGFKSGQTFSYGYNWDWTEDDDPDLLDGRYLAGRYTVNSSDSLQDLINKVNEGTQSRVGIKLDGETLAAAIKNGGTAAVCMGNEAYIFGSAALAGGTVTIPAVSGRVDKYTATGSYDDDGFEYSSVKNTVGYGYGLTQEQIKKLEDAGLDLTAMGLKVAEVSASGTSLVGSAQAKTQLIARLNQAWVALGLSSLSALSTCAGVTSGFIMNSAIVKASAGSDVLSGAGLTATIKDGKTLVVHTGVYADANGNWTDNARIASALGFTEITINILNQDKTLQEVSLPGNKFVSENYFTGTSGGKNYLMNSAFNKAGLLAELAFGHESANASTPPVSDVSSAVAQAQFLANIKAEWENKYQGNNYSGLAVTANTGAGLANISATSVYNANTASISGSNSASVIKDGATIKVNTGVYVDSNGNFTTDSAVAKLFGSNFAEIVVTVKNSAGPDDNLIFSLSGGSLTAGVTFPSLSADTTTLSDILSSTGGLNTVLKNEIAARQNAQGLTGTAGNVTIFPPSTDPWPPQDYAELKAAGASTTEIQPTGDLTTTIDYAGLTSSITTGALAPMPNTTNLGNIILAVKTGLSEFLTSLQTTATNPAGLGLIDVGRVVSSLATPPSGPNGMAEVDNPNVTSEFYSGTLDYSLATGSYSNSGDVYSSTKGYALTSVQLSILRAAGLDLTNLNLASAIISASTSSKVSSADARAMLVDKLAQIWSALNMANMSAISVSVGATSGYSALDTAKITASATAGTTSGIGDAATLKEQKSFIVHTGVYADSAGNWTGDKDLASALGLKEITYTVENNDYTPRVASADYRTSAYWTSGGLYVTSATNSALAKAGFNMAAFSAANYHLSASAATNAEALTELQNKAIAYWATTYGSLANVVFTSGDTGAGIPALTASAIDYSSPSNAANLTAPGGAGEIISGGSITVNTGVYVDGNGNWTQDSAIASAFGMEELVYTLSRGTGAQSGYYSAVIEFGGNTFYAPTTGDLFDGTTYNVQGMTQLGQDIATSIGQAISAVQAAAKLSTPGLEPGKLAKGGTTGVPAPTLSDITASVNAYNPGTTRNTAGGTVGDLAITVSLDGKSISWATTPLPTSTSMKDLAKALSDDIERVIQTAQTDKGMQAGRLFKILASTHKGPTTEAQVTDLDWEDIYKKASGPQTVSTVGIVDKTKHATLVASAGTAYVNASGISNFGAWALASAINHNKDSEFWAMVQSHDSNGQSADMVYVFTKKGGDYNSLLACDVADGDVASREALQAIEFENVAANEINQSGTTFTLGGENWATFKPIQTKAGMGKEVWNLTLNGRDVGSQRDLWIAALNNGENEIKTPGLTDGIINGLDRHSFVEIQNAANGEWAGAEVRTQSSAQEALEALNGAMERKDKVRADIGALQNRLENTITNLEIQMEALQASESRISDVDVATEMTEFVRNQVLAQAAVSMLSQANSLPQMALSLLNA